VLGASLENSQLTSGKMHLISGTGQLLVEQTLICPRKFMTWRPPIFSPFGRFRRKFHFMIAVRRARIARASHPAEDGFSKVGHHR
jgi:hypothetical protein